MKTAQESSGNFDEDMEETFVGQRRQSIHPLGMLSRKSIMPRKSIAPPHLDRMEVSPANHGKVRFDVISSETPALHEPQASGSKVPGIARKSMIKRKFDEFPEISKGAKSRCAIETPPREKFTQPYQFEAPKEPIGDFDCFLKPQAPCSKSGRPFELLDEEEETTSGPFYGINDTACTTQQFNLFLPAQSVSTPISKRSQKFSMAERQSNSPPTAQSEDFEGNAPSEGQQTMPQPKQLSTIMETTETTSSTKSTVEVNSPENLETQESPESPEILENYFGGPTSNLIPHIQVNEMACGLSFQVFDDQTTQTIPLLNLVKPQNIATPIVKVGLHFIEA